MGIPVLILGRSGSGKSASLRNFKKDEVGIINVMGKPLPFRNQLPTVTTDNYRDVWEILVKTKSTQRWDCRRDHGLLCDPERNQQEKKRADAIRRNKADS